MAIAIGDQYYHSYAYYRVVAFDQPFENWDGKIFNDGVQLERTKLHAEFDDWQPAGVQRIATVKKWKPRAKYEWREDHYKELQQAVGELSSKLTGHLDQEVFIGLMDKGKPCVKLVLSETQLGEILAALDK